MPEDVISKLESFSPVPLDRDALLFAAGRASVRPTQVWKRLAGVLAATQTLSLALGLWYWSRTEPRPDPMPRSEPPAAVITESEAVPSFDPSSIYVLSHDPERLSRSVAGGTGTGRPSLSAFSRDFQP